MDSRPLHLTPGLSPLGIRAIKHWQEHRPLMLAQMLEQLGQLGLIEHVKRTVETALDEYEQISEKLMSGQQYSPAQAHETAMEIILGRYILLPTEEDVPLLGEKDGVFAYYPDSGA